MSYRAPPHRSLLADAVYDLLDPIPYGCFVATLIFDILYASTAAILWAHAAAWLVTIGLLFAIVPRLINLVQVWITGRRWVLGAGRLDFWLNLVAIVLAIANAFVHSRDAYGVVPANVWLSAFTVLLLAIARVVMTTAAHRAGEVRP
ncbi:MAG TPA: DUF2231 domain-containing protein [Frateuria sp.]|uniref:DUF2231 domain-containing protein n=1 Tax=Frateuria sp. TaxID=2211372 RepID=UPI002D7F1CC8|nr:DUF2231 domain-containing protein [Frateuria sp.]HET6807118.1 DUF2231 domain-containing protein [Frateuria sp.]